MSLAIVQLAIVLATLLLAWAILTRIRASAHAKRWAASCDDCGWPVASVLPCLCGKHHGYTSTARQRRAWRRERLVVAYRKNTRRV